MSGQKVGLYEMYLKLAQYKSVYDMIEQMAEEDVMSYKFRDLLLGNQEYKNGDKS